MSDSDLHRFKAGAGVVKAKGMYQKLSGVSVNCLPASRGWPERADFFMVSDKGNGLGSAALVIPAETMDELAEDWLKQRKK